MLSNFSGKMDIDKIIVKSSTEDYKFGINYNINTSRVGEAPSEPTLSSKSPWEKQGLNPFASLLSSGSEHVSKTSGLLTVSVTDLVLPGRGNLDLVIKRTYTSKAHSEPLHLNQK